MSNLLENLVARLQRIATLNEDEFSYKICLTPRAHRISPVVYEFVCVESCDGHDFVSGRAPTLNEAVQQAEAEISNACAAWGYKDNA